MTKEQWNEQQNKSKLEKREEEFMALTFHNENMNIIEDALVLEELFNTPTCVEYPDDEEEALED